MADFFEIDFLAVETKKSGDAIVMRYEINGLLFIHVVDGGFISTGDKLVEHINQHYGAPDTITHVVATHPDGDHAAGLRTVLESFNVGTLWMLRPWIYAEEIIDRFARFTNVENLKARLKELYPNIHALEEIAIAKGIQIREPFQGTAIGAFRVMAPTKARYLDLIVQSDKTPESIAEATQTAADSLGETIKKVLAKAAALLKAAWGAEVFSPDETSAENEMSVIQYAYLCGNKILLTADAGRAALTEAADYAPTVGLVLPGIDRIQVPHHGSRRNVSTELLDRWLGPRLPNKPADGEELFKAFCSSAKEDEDHPRKSVIRAFIHRGARFYQTEGQSLRTAQNAPPRIGWEAVTPVSYPDEQES